MKGGREEEEQTGMRSTALNQAGPAGLSEEAIIKLNKVGRQDIFIVKERSVHEGIRTQLKDALELHKQLPMQPEMFSYTWNVCHIMNKKVICISVLF